MNKTGGGLRIKKKPKRGDQALLEALWKRFGGPAEVAKKISAYAHEEISCQAPINWRLRGQVPHRYVKITAEALGISPLGLSYSVLSNLAEDVPSWTDVVKSYGLPKAIVEEILFLKPPATSRKEKL